MVLVSDRSDLECDRHRSTVNLMFLCFKSLSANFFDHEIRSDSKSLEHFILGGNGKQYHHESVMKGVKIYKFATTPAVITMFSERGMMSGQLYQPEINHRQIQHSFLNHGRNTDTGFQRAMKLSHCNPMPSEHFSRNNFISMHWYGLQALTPDDYGPKNEDVLARNSLMSHSKLKLKSFTSSVDRESYINHRTATSLTGAVFKRALEFFNRTWVDENGNEVSDETNPTPADLCAFAELFTDAEIETKDGFVKFLGRFKMDALFVYQADRSHFENLRMFSDLLRSLVPMRPGVFDGQHRWFVLALFCSGYFFPKAIMPLQRQVGSDPIPDEFSACYDNWQCWTGDMMMAVGHPAEEDLLFDTKQLHKLLSRFGEDVTESQALSIAPNYAAVSNFVSKAIVNRWEKLSVCEMDYKNYWSYKPKSGEELKINSNLSQIYAQLDLAIKSNSQLAGYVRHNIEPKKSAVDSWTTIYKATKSSFTNFRNWVGKTHLSGNSRAGIPVKLGYYLNMLKAMCHDKDSVQLLDQFFREPSPEHKQIVRESELNVPNCTSVDYLWDYVLRPASAMKEHIKQRIIVEYKIIHTLSSKDDNAELEKKHVAYMQKLSEAPTEESMEEVIKRHPCIVFPTGKSTSIDLNKMKLKSSPLPAKLQFAFYASMIRQFLLAISTYGFDPDFQQELDREKRHKEKLRLYL